MALGEWVSVQTSREAAEHQLEIEADELDTFPDEEQKELRLIYQANGLSEEDAAALADSLTADRRTALATVASVVASGVGLFLLGAATTLITGRSALTSGVRELLIGWAAAAVTYGLGAPSA